jgi:GNAT superfamily N-acetyltransferase
LDDEGHEIIMRLDLQTPSPGSPEEEKVRIPVRIMEEQDITTISEAFCQPPWNKSDGQYQRYFQEQTDGKRIVLVAFYNDEFAGYGTICWTSKYAPFAEQQIPEIVDLNVLEQFRRKGIATQLMDRAEAEIAKRSPIAGIGVGLYPDYGPAQRMYVLRGYVPDARGLMRDGKSVESGTSVVVDDALTIHLTKKLK